MAKSCLQAAIDFLIRVGTSVSNLGKDWKDELTEKELQSLQYEVSLNGVKEEIRHKTMAFAATIVESEDDAHHRQESSPQEEANSFGAESSQEDDEGLFIPSYLEEALPEDPTLQVKMAHAMWAQEMETRRCFTCNKPGHPQKDHWKYEEKMGLGPYSQRGLPKTSWLKSGQSQNPLSQVK